MKVKFCGITNLEDAIKAETLGADMLGFIAQPGQIRYVAPYIIAKAKSVVKVPVVAVKLEMNFMDVLDIADYIQIHKVLENNEIETLNSYSAKFILYVPSSKEGLNYIRLIDKVHNAVPLIDSAKKGTKVDLEIAKELLNFRPDAGLGGGITPDNVQDYLKLNPAWIDVSSGIESTPGKKDEQKMKRIIEVVKHESN
ncbi:MAG: phosphoribosylanthranilate isomerase [Nitrososphaeria archaeon]|jgi:phosphoribosylanthranilate isomerase